MEDKPHDKIQMTDAENRFSTIFNNLPVAILEEDISEVKKAIDYLKAEGITDFEGYFDENPDFVRRLATTIRILCANNAAVKLYKAKDKSELLNSINRLFTENSYDVLKQELIAMAKDKKYFEAEDVNINFHGEPINILLHVALSMEDSGFPTRLVSINDITERKKAESRLSLQYEIIRILAESDEIPETMQKVLKCICTHCGCEIGEIWFIDRKRCALSLCSVYHTSGWEGSEFIERSKGYTFKKGVGLPGRVWESCNPCWIYDVTMDSNFPRMSIASKAGICSAFAFPIIKNIKNNKVIGVMVFFFRDRKSPNDEMMNMFGAVGLQIGEFIERRRIQAALEESEKRYRELIENIEEIVFSLDTYGTATYISPSVEKHSGYSASDVVGRSFLKFIHPDDHDRALDHFRRHLKGEIEPFEVRLLSKDGEVLWFRVSKKPVLSDGEIIGLSGVMTDLTKYKKREAELEKKHTLEAIGTLAGGIAHDFNNLLTAILGNISVVKMQMSPDSRDFVRLTEAEDICMKAAELTGRLITFSKGGEPVRKVLSIKGLICETISSELEDTDINCECDIPSSLSPAYADEVQMRQVFRNIVVNAKEAMPGGGVIRVSAEENRIGRDDAILKEGDYVKITIKDNGKGISEEVLPKIFDPYFTTKGMGAEKGMGLGLAVCYSIIKKHEGHIEAESKVGEGTTFHIYLPAAKAETIKTAKEDKPAASEKKRVLFMDDEDYIRSIAVQMLEHLGYEVEQTRDGSEAIKTYKEAKESGKRFDAVILDLTVHDGMGGDMAIARLISIDPEVRAIVSSGYADSPVMTGFRKYGFAGAIAKPYSMEMLKETLDKALAGKEEDI